MKEQIIQQLTQLFRKKGYAALSIADIAKATDLSKSSLYHYFPGGKNEMAQLVLVTTYHYLKEEITTNLQRTPAKSQVKMLLNMLSSFYDRGNLNCLLDVMSILTDDTIVHNHLKLILDTLIQAFASALVNQGLTKSKAHKEAIIIIMQIQGALILSRATQDTKYFEQILKDLLTHFNS